MAAGGGFRAPWRDRIDGGAEEGSGCRSATGDRDRRAGKRLGGTFLRRRAPLGFVILGIPVFVSRNLGLWG